MDKQELDRFNRKLVDDFGYFNGTDPSFRLVYSEDQFEKRLVYHTKEGLELITPVVELRPKYRQWIHNKYVLERLTVIPMEHEELTVDKLSYENIWTFQDRNGDYLEPKYEAAKFVINTLLGNTLNPSNLAKYKTTNEEERQALIKRIDEIEEMLYGNETKVTDSLARDNAVGYGIRNRSDTRFN